MYVLNFWCIQFTPDTRQKRTTALRIGPRSSVHPQTDIYSQFRMRLVVRLCVLWVKRLQRECINTKFADCMSSSYVSMRCVLVITINMARICYSSLPVCQRMFIYNVFRNVECNLKGDWSLQLYEITQISCLTCRT